MNQDGRNMKAIIAYILRGIIGKKKEDRISVIGIQWKYNRRVVHDLTADDIVKYKIVKCGFIVEICQKIRVFLSKNIAKNIKNKLEGFISNNTRVLNMAGI